MINEAEPSLSEESIKLEEPSQLTGWDIAAWIFTIIYFILFLATLNAGSLIGMLIFASAGLIMSPPFAKWLDRKDKRGNFIGIRLIVIFFTIVGTAALILFGFIPSYLDQRALNKSISSYTSNQFENRSLIPDPKPTIDLTYQKILSFSGKGAKNSEPFVIQGSRFKVKYDCKGGLCQAFLESPDNSPAYGLVMNDIGNLKDETIFYGAGEYYIRVNAGDVYTIVVEDYK